MLIGFPSRWLSVNVFDNLGDVMVSTLMLGGEDGFFEESTTAEDEDSNDSTEVQQCSTFQIVGILRILTPPHPCFGNDPNRKTSRPPTTAKTRMARPSPR